MSAFLSHPTPSVREKETPPDMHERTRGRLPRQFADWFCLALWGAGVFLCEEMPVALTLLCAMAVHECGHVAAFLLLGEPMPTLCAGRLGLQLSAVRPMSPRQECIAALVGPGINLLCSFGLLGLFGPGLPFYIHLMTAAGNLAPVGTLDGGRILRCLCETHLPPRAAHILWRGVSLATVCAGMWLSLCALWCRGEGGYLFFLCFSLFLSHICTSDST